MFKQLSHFFFTTTFRLKIRLFLFYRFMLFWFLFSSYKILFENYSFMFLFRKNLFRNNFIVFFFAKVFFFQIFFSFFNVALMLEIFYRSMFFFVFEFYNFDRKHSNLMFFHIVVFSKEKFVNSFFYFSRTLFYFEIFLFFVQSKNFSIRLSM